MISSPPVPDKPLTPPPELAAMIAKREQERKQKKLREVLGTKFV